MRRAVGGSRWVLLAIAGLNLGLGAVKLYRGDMMGGGLHLQTSVCCFFAFTLMEHERRLRALERGVLVISFGEREPGRGFRALERRREDA